MMENKLTFGSKILEMLYNNYLHTFYPELLFFSEMQLIYMLYHNWKFWRLKEKFFVSYAIKSL